MAARGGTSRATLAAHENGRKSPSAATLFRFFVECRAGKRDLDVFVDAEQVEDVLTALPEGVRVDTASRKLLTRHGQARLCWDRTPVEVFLDKTPFHRSVFERACWESFGGAQIPFLSCRDIAVFKAFVRRGWPVCVKLPGVVHCTRCDRHRL